MIEDNYNQNNISAPDSRQAEYQIIADLVSTPSCVPIARSRLDSGMFSDPAARDAWTTILAMSDAGDTIDISTVGVRVRKQVVMEVMKSLYTMGSCTDLTVAAHCEALTQAFYRRRAYLAAMSIIESASDLSVPYEDLMSRVADKTAEMTGSPVSGRDPEPIAKVMKDLEDELEEIQTKRNEGRRTRVPTGLQLLDTLTLSGFGPGNLVILAARPSVGKTAMMLKMARTAAASGFPACVYSLEMMNTELARRLLVTSGTVSPIDLASGNFSWEAVELECARYTELPLWFNDKARTIDDIVSGIIAAHSAGICEIAFIDYLGLMRGTDRRMPLNQAIGEMTARLKRTAKECQIPVVLLCQMNRNIESENRSPQLRDLRDSGSIEQDADIVLMLERDPEDRRVINVWVRKNRHGKAGDIVFGLRANETFTDFEQISGQEVDEL